MGKQRIILYWDGKVKKFIAKAPEIGDMSAFGKSQSEAIANVLRLMETQKISEIKNRVPTTRIRRSHG